MKREFWMIREMEDGTRIEVCFNPLPSGKVQVYSSNFVYELENDAAFLYSQVLINAGYRMVEL